MNPLRLLKLQQVPDNGIEEFRVSPPWLSVLLIGGVIGFCFWVGLQGGIGFGKDGALPGFIAWWIVFWLGLFWLVLANICLKALKPSAWLVRADSQGLYIKWRSYQNVAWQTEGPQVIYVPYSAIAEVHRHKRRWDIPEHRHGGTQQISGIFLELQLRGVNTTELAQRLAEERAGRPDGKPVKQTRWGHFPVSLEPSDLLRIEWRAKPGIQIVLDLLQKRGVTIANPMTSRSDLTSQPNETGLRELARQGDLMGLIRAIRAGNNISLEEAHSQAKAMIAETQHTPPQDRS